ncbi:MAG: LLM class flavin-dependent oxidoreductase, partial [Acidimicrobiales bacterium]
YDLLEDALLALPKLWGPGAKPFDGRVLHLPETICYPRPVQEHIPIVVGGGGERRTLRLAARYADGVNVMGGIDVMRRKVEVLHRHCDEAGRDRTEVAVTHLAPTLVGDDRADVRQRIDRLRPPRLDPAAFAARTNAGTVDDQVGRLHELAGAGVDEVIVSLPDLGLEPGDPAAAVERFGAAIAAFR